MLSLMYYVVHPSVDGGLGPATIMRPETWPPEVIRLEYMFDDWLGDVLLESFPCFIATDEFVTELEAAGSTGFTRRDLEVSRSEKFTELNPGADLPPFVWLHVSGEPGVDDLGLTPQAELVISDRVYSRLKTRLLGADYELFLGQEIPGLIEHYAVVHVRRSASTVELGIDGRDGVVLGSPRGQRQRPMRSASMARATQLLRLT